MTIQLPLQAGQPLVVRVAEQFRANLAASEGVQRTLMAQRWLQVENAVSHEIDLLVDKAYYHNRELKDWEVFQMERYQSLNAQVTREIQRYIEDAETLIDEGSRAQVVQGATNARTLTQLAGQDVGRTLQVDLMRLNPSAVENVVSIARAGQPLGDLMSLAYGEASDGMVNELINGIALGRNPRDTARRMRVDGLSRGFAHTELVARDQHNRAYRAASQRQYQESGVVGRFIRLAAKNDRTCLACLALDGEVYDVEALMEVHPQDRCTMVPWPNGIPRVTFQTGAEWFAGLPSDRQRAIMGPSRHDAWLAGDFQFSQMATRRENATWGPSAIVTPVRALRRSA